jgi:hypothetical protein
MSNTAGIPINHEKKNIIYSLYSSYIKCLLMQLILSMDYLSDAAFDRNWSNVPKMHRYCSYEIYVIHY